MTACDNFLKMYKERTIIKFQKQQRAFYDT